MSPIEGMYPFNWAFLLFALRRALAMDAKQDTRHVDKVRSAGERSINQPADASVKTSPVHKTDIITPARHASRTMTGKR